MLSNSVRGLHISRLHTEPGKKHLVLNLSLQAQRRRRHLPRSTETMCTMLARLQDVASASTYEPRRPINPTFKYFSRLPTEIRWIIWQLAIPCRVTNAHKTLQSSSHFDYWFRHEPPILAQVCRESRAVARRTGGIVVSSVPPYSYPARYWFDSRRDTFRIYSIEDIGLVPPSVEDILFPWGSLLYPHSGEQNIDLAFFPKLKLFQIEIDWRYLPPDIWNAWADRRLQAVGEPGTIFLDLDDEHQVQRFANMLLSRPEWCDLSRLWLKEISYLREEKFRLHATHEEQDWKAAREQLQERWLRRYRENIAYAGSNSNEEPMRAGMPEFRRVLSLFPLIEMHYQARMASNREECYMLFTEREPERRLLRPEIFDIHRVEDTRRFFHKVAKVAGEGNVRTLFSQVRSGQILPQQNS
ncbi:hypothetical protein F5Y09DRAFT_312173 [Xylaria sp. FL1042]|nr:hypothetical protein F5Y09DRAFT_312173 [Xylaria sp. FL1042]